MKTSFLLAASVFFMILCPGGKSFTLARQRLYVFNYERILGTSLELKIGAASQPDAEAAEAAVLNEIDRQSKILSSWDSDSEFSRWSRTFMQPVRVSPELFEVLGLFDQWRERTGGALDASAEVVTRVWKVAEQQQRTPSASEIAAAVNLVRQTHWRLDPKAHTATHLSNAPLVLSSFTKSYIAGHAADAALARTGVDAVVVNIGGDLVVRGNWTEPVDIADPKAAAENSPPIATVAIHDRTVATSGNYRRGVEIGGKHYSHIVDPRTGMPAEAVISSTVVARDPSDAGAMATAFSVLTPEQSRTLAASIPGAEFLLVLADGRQIRSGGWSALEAGSTHEAATTETQQASAGPVSILLASALTTRANGPLLQVARTPSAGTGAWDPSLELAVSVELAQRDARARRPYLAVWIEDQDKFPVRTLALWYNKDQFLPELRAWNHAEHLRSLAGAPALAHSISSATRPAGKYTLKWDGKDDAGKLVKAGKYTVYIEAAREHGGYVLLHQEMDFSGVPQTIPLKGSTEVASASLDYRKIARTP
jgi:thiamine biosynthesis lipoprotein ApbE